MPQRFDGIDCLFQKPSIVFVPFSSFLQPRRIAPIDRIVCDNKGARRINGRTASVVAVDPPGSSMTVELASGERQMLDLRHLADRHVRPGWVRTIHSAQGATADRVMAHMESFRANTVDAASAYVAISRARKHATVYTENRVALVSALDLRDGAQLGAIDETLTRYGPGATLDGPGLEIQSI